mgnify:CR=1 FL=1
MSLEVKNLSFITASLHLRPGTNVSNWAAISKAVTPGAESDKEDIAGQGNAKERRLEHTGRAERIPKGV